MLHDVKLKLPISMFNMVYATCYRCVDISCLENDSMFKQTDVFIFVYKIEGKYILQLVLCAFLAGIDVYLIHF